MSGNLPEQALLVVDTGHGNTAVLATPEGVGVIDAGTGPALLMLLEGLDTFDIAWMLLSHADKDHIGGAVAVLADPRFRLRRLRVNPDSQKASKTWDHLAYEASLASDLDFQPTLTPALTGEFDLGRIRVEILAPSTYLSTKGAGGRDREERKIDTNSLSAVVRVRSEAVQVLLPGDLDRVGLDDATARGMDLRADVAVWPHHGGLAGTSATQSFVSDLCATVNPDFVIFSIGRRKHRNPRPDVVRSVRGALASARIACTQLSQHCADRLTAQSGDASHLSGLFSLGHDSGETCAGTIVFDLASGEVSPERAAHFSFVTAHAPTALCG